MNKTHWGRRLRQEFSDFLFWSSSVFWVELRTLNRHDLIFKRILNHAFHFHRKNPLLNSTSACYDKNEIKNLVFLERISGPLKGSLKLASVNRMFLWLRSWPFLAIYFSQYVAFLISRCNSKIEIQYHWTGWRGIYSEFQQRKFK